MDLEKVTKSALEIIKKENDKVYELIKDFNKFDREFEVKILKSSVNELKQMYLNNEISIYDCILIHWKQICLWEPKINCVTELCYNEAMNQCKLLENKLKNYKNINEMPSLFGIPYSCKDEEYMKDYYSTWGMKYWLKEKMNKDDTVVEFVKKSDGVIIVRGNVPQLLFTCESVNHIFGRSKNPYDLERTVGGSSGGDGGINSIGGVKLSLVRDGAGSVRIPAIFCGLVSFKPSYTRNYDKNIKVHEINTCKLLESSKGVFGKNLEDVILHTKAYFEFNNKQLINKSLLKPCLPFNNILYNTFKDTNKKLNIGYIYEFEYIPISEPVKNVMNEVICKLKNKNHNLVFLEEVIPILEKVSENFLKLLFDKKSNFHFLGSEKIIDEYKLSKLNELLPNSIKKIIFNFFRIIGEKRVYDIYINSKVSKNNKMYLNEIYLLYYKFVNIMKKNNIDCLLMPGLPFPALKHKQSGDLAVACVYYLGIFNLLNLPSSTIPIRLIKKNEEIYKDDKNNKDNLYKQIVSCMKNSTGNPVSIQLITLKNEDEKLLGIMNHFKEFIEMDLNSLIK